MSQQEGTLLTVSLPDGERIIMPLKRLVRSLYRLAVYPMRIFAGYLLFGWRGALLALVLSLAPTENEKKLLASQSRR